VGEASGRRLRRTATPQERASEATPTHQSIDRLLRQISADDLDDGRQRGIAGRAVHHDVHRATGVQRHGDGVAAPAALSVGNVD
jgi:hypothetical protein